MKKLWQLKKLSDGSALNEPQLLPENWGPIFGLSNILDKLGDLSWLGDSYKDMGWFEVEDVPLVSTETTEKLVWNRAKTLLSDSDWSMLSDVPMTAGQKSAWIEYRRALRDIRLQPGFPNAIEWPPKPE